MRSVAQRDLVADSTATGRATGRDRSSSFILGRVSAIATKATAASRAMIQKLGTPAEGMADGCAERHAEEVGQGHAGQHDRDGGAAPLGWHDVRGGDGGVAEEQAVGQRHQYARDEQHGVVGREAQNTWPRA